MVRAASDGGGAELNAWWQSFGWPSVYRHLLHLHLLQPWDRLLATAAGDEQRPEAVPTDRARAIPSRWKCHSLLVVMPECASDPSVAAAVAVVVVER